MEERIIKSNRVVIFDYLKAFAIILVIINHYGHTSWNYLVKNSFIYPSVIQMAVPIFMIVTGCTFSISYDKRYYNLHEMYKPKELIIKVLRFWIPFFFAFVIEVLLYIFIYNRSFTLFSLAKAFLVGGPGLNGSYYVPVLIQLVFVFPLIFEAVRRYNTKGLIICIAVNFLYELLCNTCKINSGLYRILMPRYITYIALGTWLYFRNYKVSKKMCLGAVILGLTYIVIRFLGYKPFIFKLWSGTSMIIALYIFPIAAYFIAKYKDFSLTSNNLMLTIGNASYHIFLVQMIFYNNFNYYIINVFNTPIVNIPLNIIICVGAGIGFYQIEKGISRRILKMF